MPVTLAALPAIASGAGAVMGLAKGLFGPSQQERDERQLRQQAKLQELQIAGQKEMGMFNQAQALDMFNKTGYEAQKKQMEAAGLNPALMYGTAGGGGTTQGGQAGSVAGAMADGAAASKQADTANQSNMAQMGLMLAQMKVMESQADKNNAEAENLRGADRENTVANTNLANSNTILNKIRAEIQGKSIEEQLEIIRAERDKSQDQARQERTKALVGENTATAQVAITNQQATNLAIEAVAINQSIKLDKAKIEEISAGIEQRWKELNINETKSRYEHADRLKSIEEYTTNALKVAGIMAAGNIASDVVKIATRRPPGGGSSTRQERWDGDGNHTGGSQTTTNHW